jgi:hypothetical protein
MKAWAYSQKAINLDIISRLNPGVPNHMDAWLCSSGKSFDGTYL